MMPALEMVRPAGRLLPWAMPKLRVPCPPTAVSAVWYTAPTRALGRVLVVMVTGASTEMLALALWVLTPSDSVKLTERLPAEPEAGEPEMAPVEAFSTRPAGSGEEARVVQV